MKNAASVKERLKNYAKKNNRIVQDIFTIYVLERTLYRISISEYRDKFTLKGGILLYGLFSEDFTCLEGKARMLDAYFVGS
ncbi:MAG: nucleotidyl transferase AbiEii/AbiGii toxin family protein [Solobacterium sp.]|nr:nucleotidyl transferase AbiEii/AbiGii toxin family protein [Solobacterium sp.]